MKEDASLRQYIKEVCSVWGDGKNPDLPFKIKILLERLLAWASPQEDWIAELIEKGLPAREIYRDKNCGFLLTGHVYEKGYSDSPHDHGPAWVVHGIYYGVAEVTTYRRTNRDAAPGRATLEGKETHRLTPGMAFPCLPGEIHSTSVVEHSVVVRFLSRDLNKPQRRRYDRNGA